MSQLLDLINQFGGAQAVEAMAARVGLSPEQAQSGMAALLPAVAGGMAHQAATDPGALDAAAAPATALIQNESAASDAAIDHGSGLLGSLFGSHETASAVTDHAAAATGLDASKLAALLPMVATLAAGALGHAGGQAAAPAEGGIGGMLGGLLGQVSGGGTAATGGGAANVLGAILGGLGGGAGGAGGGSTLDTIMGLANRFRGH